MGSLVLGIILGLLLSVVIGFIGGLIYGRLYKTWAEITCVITTVVLCIGFTIAITLAICSYNKLQSTCYVERYKVCKQTMEESLDSSKISGMERLQLVQDAVNQNIYLTQQQFDCQQWYGFLIDQRVLELEPINFE